MNTAADVRAACRSGQLVGPTPGLAPGFVQANLVMLPADWAFDFLLFCQRNPKPCPLLDVTDIGDPEPKYAARTPGSLMQDLGVPSKNTRPLSMIKARSHTRSVWATL